MTNQLSHQRPQASGSYSSAGSRSSRSHNSSSSRSRSFLASMEKLLYLLRQPVRLKRVRGCEVLYIGPDGPSQTSCQLAVCFHMAACRALDLPSVSDQGLDFHLHTPFQIPAHQQTDVAALLFEINAMLPLGCLRLSDRGGLIYVYALPLHQPELPASQFLETVSLMLSCYSRLQPLLLALANGELDAGARGCLSRLSQAGQLNLTPVDLSQRLNALKALSA